jgi:hypothetical protein
LVLTSALASQIKQDGTSYDFLGVVDHANCESGISFLIRPSGGPVWFAVYRGVTLWVYEIPWDIGYNFCRSQQELPEYTKIIHTLSRKKEPLYGVKNGVFFLLHQKGTLVKANRVRKTYVLQLVKGYQNHPHMALHDLPYVKKWGVKIFIKLQRWQFD